MSQVCPLLLVVQQQITEDKRDYIVETRFYVAFLSLRTCTSLGENPSITMTETRFYEPARLSTPPKPLLSLKPLDANLVEVIVI